MSNIEWTGKTWNPVVGCTVTSPGCKNCYAMRMAGRLANNPATPQYADTVQKIKDKWVWTGHIGIAPDRVWIEPLRRQKPTTYFVNSMGDLFHPNVPDELIDRAFAVMALAPQHTFQILTKHADRMREYMCTEDRKKIIAATVLDISDLLAIQAGTFKARPTIEHFNQCFAGSGAFPNVWLGVSVEDNDRRHRVDDLMATPAAVRFVSYEPALGPLDDDIIPGLDWLIAGGESGPGARPAHPDWFRQVRDVCARHGVPFFFKQWGEWLPWEEFDYTSIVDEMEQTRFETVAWTGEDWENLGRPMWMDCHADDQFLGKVGKKAAGRVLDGQTHDGMPVIPTTRAQTRVCCEAAASSPDSGDQS